MQLELEAKKWQLLMDEKVTELQEQLLVGMQQSMAKVQELRSELAQQKAMNDELLQQLEAREAGAQ